MKKLVVDKEKCIGSQACIAIVPEVFELDENGKSKVKDQKGADESKIEDAISACPVRAISWVEE
jgi:ferredoxin